MNKNFRSLIGVVALMGIFVPMAAFAVGKCQLPDNLQKLKDESTEDKENEKCQSSQQVPGTAGKCVEVYKAARQSIDDYQKKLDAACGKQEVAETKAILECKAGDTCEKGQAALTGTAANSKREQSVANKGLAQWVAKKGKEAADASAAIKAARDSGFIDSGVSNAAIQEHSTAKSFADKVSSELKKESDKNAAAAKQAEKVKTSATEKTTNMNSAPTDIKEALTKSSDATKAAEAAAGAAGGGAPSIPSPPSSAAGAGDTAAAPIPTSSMDGQGSLDPGTGAATASSGSAKSMANDLKLDITPQKNTDGVLMADGTTSSTSASKMDTSLRDSLKKKLLGGAAASSDNGDAIGGMPFGGGDSASKKAKAADTIAAASLTAPSGGGGDSGGASNEESGDDFSMARSETDAAVKNLINEFSGSGNNNDGRNLADTENGALSGIEGANGGNLFHRIRGTIVRHLQNGDVTNGVNGKI